MSIDRLKAVKAEPGQAIEPALPPGRGRPPKQQDVRPAADEDPAERSPEQETEQRPPTYAQVTRRGRVVRPPERYIAVTKEKVPETTV